MLSKYHNKVPVHVMHEIHSKGKCSPGLTFKEIKEILPDIFLSEDCESREKGWFLNEKPETS